MLDLSAIAAARTITLTNDATVNGITGTGGNGLGFAGIDASAAATIGGGFNNIERIDASAAATTNILNAQPVDAGSANPLAGTVVLQGTNSTFAAGGETLTFNDFQAVNTGVLNDTVTVVSDVTVDLTTGPGADTLTVNAGITLGDATVPAGFNVDMGSDDDTVTLNANARIAGSVLLGFGADSIELQNQATIGGFVQGDPTAVGADGVDTLNFETYTTARNVTVTDATLNTAAIPQLIGFTGTEASITGGFTAIDFIIASSRNS